MVNFSFIVLLSLGILFLVSPSYQRGNLYVDTIYSSSGDVVTIDTLYGGDAEVTDSSANTVSFGNFDNVNLNAQRISLQGSFALLEGSTSVVIDSTAGEAAVSAGNAVNANSNTFNLNANQTAYFTSDNGEISLIAGDQFTSTSGGFNLQTDVGGVLLSSLAGDINLNSDGNFIINSNDELNLKTTYDIVFTTPSSVGVSASAGTADLESRNHIVFDSENSISLVSDGQRIGFNSGDFTVMNSNSFTATGDNQLKIQSFTSGIRMTSFGQTSFSSNSDLTLEGDTKGVSLFSNGASTGIIQLSSSTQSIYFTSQGKGDENTGILVNSDSVNANIVRTASFNSNDDGIIRGNGDITIKTGGSFGVDTQNFDSSSSKFTDMSTQFTLSGNNINVYAFNEATSGNANGLIDIYGDVIEYNSNLHTSIHGGDVSFTADQGGVSLTSSSNVIISASRGDNDQHSIAMTSTNFTFTANDASIIGGEILLYGSQQVISCVYTVFITPEALTPNYVRFIATDDLYLSGDSLTHTSTDSLNFFSSFANGNSGLSGIYFTSDTTTVLSQLGYGITMISKGDFTTTASSVTIQSLNADFSVTEDFALTTASSLQISAHSYKLQTYSLSFDSLDNNSTTNSQNIQFTSSKIHFSTPRNEASDDTISANYANIDLSQQNLYFTGLNEGKFSAGNLAVESNDIVVSSDDRESMNLNVGSMTLTSTSDVYFTGDSVAISSLNSSFTSSSDASFSITDDQRGLLLQGGAINVTAAQDIYLTPDNILIDSLGNITFVNLKGATNFVGSDSIAYSSENGALSLFANTTLSVSSGHNIYLNTGDYSGDTLSISSTTFEITSTDSTSTSISNGNLAISTTNATITGDSVSFSGLGPLTVTTSVYTLDTETLATFGGNIDISSTNSTIDWTSSSFLINSTEGSIATQEVNKTAYEILFSAGGDISIATESTSGQFHATADRLEIFALNPTKATNLGDITINAPSVSLSSNLQNQFVQFTSGGLINITSAQDMTVQSSGDYFLEAKNSAQFYASGIQSVTGGTFTFDAALNSCVNISHIGDTVNFVVQGNPSKFYNNLEVRSTDYIYTQAGDGSVLIESFGASFKRQNVDGESNGDFVFDEIVGISLRTRNEEGNIYFDSQQDTVDFVAQVDINVVALQTAYFYAINGQNYTSNGSTKFNAESGNITLRAGHDFNINANNNLYFLSSENTTLLAEDYIHMAAEQFEITSDSGDIYFNTYYNNDINILSDSISFTSGTSGMQFLAQGGIYFTADTTINVNGARGVNLLTTVGPILFDSKNTVGISTSEELFVRSGGDIVTTSGTETSFSGLGVDFTSTAADVNMQAQNFVLTSNTAILQSLGTSSTSRDRVYFNSPDIEYRSISAYIDATQLVQIGKSTLPTVAIEATGNTAVPGVIFNVASSIDLSTNGVLAFTSLLGDHTLEAQAGATFDAALGINIETHNLQFNAIQGTFEMNAFSEISFTVNSTASIASDHSIFFSTTDSQSTDGIEFDFNTALTQSGHLLNIDLDETYLSQSLSLYLVSPKQGGIVRYETLGGDISVDSQTFLSIALKRADLTAAGLMTLTTDSFSITEVASSTNGVYLQSQGASTYTGSGPYVVNAGYIDFLSSTSSIDITSPLITIAASGSFISNSTEQSTSISIANDLTMAIHNYVQFTFEDLNNDLTVGNNFNLHSSIGKFNAGDDLQIDATTSATFTAFQDLTFFSGQTLTISDNTALQGTFQSTLGNLYLATTSKRSPISMTSGTTSSIDAYSVGIRAGSEAERNSITFNVGTTLTINDVETSFMGNPTSIRSSSPVIVNVQTVTIDGANLVVNASSAYEETGVVTIGNPLSLSPVAISGTTSLTLTSEDARIISEASSSITFTGPLVNMNTNGLDAFLRFDASSITVGTTTTDATLTSTDITRITSDNGVLSLTASTLDLTTTGPADGDKLGIQFFADSSLSVSATVTTIEFVNDIFRMEALSQITITATTGSDYSGDSVTLLSKGSRENPVGSSSNFYSATSYGPHYDFVGININSPSINLESSGNIDFKSDLFYVPGAVTYTSATLPLISNYANGDFTADDLSVTSPSIRLLANSGIQFQNPSDSITVTTTGLITIDASNDAVDSNIVFSSLKSAVSITENSGSINVNSNNLMLVEGQTTSSISSSGSMSFDATRGDILFRTIAPTTDDASSSPLELSITVTGGTVSLSAGRSIRYISAHIGFFSQNGDSQHRNNYPGYASYDCVCASNACSCPDTANRIIQMYQAFLDYGLIGNTLF